MRGLWACLSPNPVPHEQGLPVRWDREKLNHCFLYLILSSNIKYLVEIIRNKRMYALQKATVGKFYSWNVFFLFCRFVQNLHAIVIKRGLLHRMSSVHLLLSLAEQIGCFFSE